MLVFGTPSNSPGVGYPEIKTPEQEQRQQYQQSVSDANGESILEWAKQLGIEVNDQTKDYLIQSYLVEQARKNEFADNVYAAQHQYQWLRDDLQKAGLNPFLALSGLNSSMAQSSSSGVSGGNIISGKNNAATNSTNLLRSVLTGILSIIGIALFKKK